MCLELLPRCLWCHKGTYGGSLVVGYNVITRNVLFESTITKTSLKPTIHRYSSALLFFRFCNHQLNEAAPGCEPSKCLTCQEDFRADFDRIAGIEFANAGITERIARKCSDFYRAIHDPCLGIGAPAGGEPLPSPLTPAATPETTTASDTAASAGNSHTKLFAMAVTLSLSLLGTAAV